MQSRRRPPITAQHRQQKLINEKYEKAHATQKTRRRPEQYTNPSSKQMLHLTRSPNERKKKLERARSFYLRISLPRLPSHGKYSVPALKSKKKFKEICVLFFLFYFRLSFVLRFSLETCVGVCVFDCAIFLHTLALRLEFILFAGVIEEMNEQRTNKTGEM